MDGVFFDEPTVREIITKRLAILAVCKCGRSVEVKPTSICVKPDTPISEVGDVLTCRRCGRTGLMTRTTLPGSEFRPA